MEDFQAQARLDEDLERDRRATSTPARTAPATPQPAANTVAASPTAPPADRSPSTPA
jgi:hypothetical protein